MPATSHPERTGTESGNRGGSTRLGSRTGKKLPATGQVRNAFRSNETTVQARQLRELQFSEANGARNSIWPGLRPIATTEVSRCLVDGDRPLQRAMLAWVARTNREAQA